MAACCGAKRAEFVGGGVRRGACLQAANFSGLQRAVRRWKEFFLLRDGVEHGTQRGGGQKIQKGQLDTLAGLG